MTQVMAKTPRWIERRNIEPKEHFQALDTDIDNIEAAIQQGQANHAELASKMDKMNARLFGVLVSLVTAAFALAANLVIHH